MQITFALVIGKVFANHKCPLFVSVSYRVLLYKNYAFLHQNIFILVQNVIKLKYKIHITNPMHLFILHIIVFLIKQNFHMYFR